MSETIKRVAIVGARGYSGLELSRLLLRHPRAQVVGCFATDNSFSLARYLPESKAAGIPTWPMSEFDARLSSFDTLFLATPAEASLDIAPKALAARVDVVDLSGAYRLQQGSVADRQAAYKEWYGFEHPQPALLEQAEYGLVPWCGPRKPGKTAGRLIANPGCYATSVLMAIIPLLRAGVIDPSSIVIDAKSGTSGGGKKASEALLFTEVDGECLPYKVASHQHTPEIVEWTKGFANTEISPFFTTHLLNVRRGIISSIYARINPGALAKTDAETDRKIETVFEDAYSGYPLVRFGALGRPETDALLQLKRVVGSARTHIAFRADGDKLHLFSLIDNLVKGAASQAVENFNRLNDDAPEVGLVDVEGVL